MGNILTLADLIAMIRRRILPILAIMLIGSLLTFVAAKRTAHVYESVAVLQVELPRVSAELALGDAISRSSQRLQLLEQELTSRETMLRMIKEHQLFSDSPGMTEAQKVTALRQSIRIETVRSGQSSFGTEQPISAILIVVQLGSGPKAAQIANELAQQVLATTTERQSQRVRETLEFYAAEERQLGQAIAALEAEITAFKNANVDALPEGMQARHDEIVRVDEALRALYVQVMALTQERTALELRGSPRVIEQRQIAALNTQLEGLANQQTAMQLRKTDVETAVNRAPMVETQLGTFALRLTQLQDQFSVLTRRRAEAETNQRLDTERQTEHFNLLEEALVPDYPLASGRRKLMVVGIFGSLMAGLVLAFILEIMNPVLRSARQMERALEIKPVIALPQLRQTRVGLAAKLWRNIKGLITQRRAVGRGKG